MKVDVTKKVKFDYEGWEDCFIEFSLPSYGDIKSIVIDVPDDEKVEKGLEVIVRLFRQGKVLSEGKVVDITKEDLKSLPIEMVIKCFQAISGEVDPKV